MVKQTIMGNGEKIEDHEIVLDFFPQVGNTKKKRSQDVNQELNFQMVHSAMTIPKVQKFRYFEIEVLDNLQNSIIVVGIMDENDKFPPSMTNEDGLNGENTLLLNGQERDDLYFYQDKQLPQGLALAALGDNVGICLHYQSNEEIVEEMAIAEQENTPKKKMEDLKKQCKQLFGDLDQMRVLMFKDGNCINSTDQMDKDKIKFNSNIHIILLNVCLQRI